MGGAAVVVAGVTERVGLLDESVVLVFDCDCDCDCEVVDGVDVDVPEDIWDVWVPWEVDDEDAAGFEDDEDDEDDEADDVDDVDETDEAEPDVMVLSVVPIVVDTPEDIIDEATELLTDVAPADTEIKLPPLLNKVTVDACPLTTTVEAVTVLCGCPELCTELVRTVANENE